MWAGAWPAVLLAIPLFFLVGCASVESRSMQYAGAPRFPPSDPAKVQIIRPPATTRPFDKLGDVYVSASVDPAPEITEVEAKLRGEAAKLGADAVLITFDQVVPVGAYVTGWYVQSVQTVSGRRIIGIALKFK